MASGRRRQRTSSPRIGRMSCAAPKRGEHPLGLRRARARSSRWPPTAADAFRGSRPGMRPQAESGPSRGAASSGVRQHHGPESSRANAFASSEPPA